MKKSVVYILVMVGLSVLLGVVDFTQKKSSDVVRDVVLDRTKGDLPNSSINLSKLVVYVPNSDLTGFDKVEKEIEGTSDSDKNMRKVIEEVSKELMGKKILKSEIAVDNIFVSKEDIYINITDNKEFSKNDRTTLAIIYSLVNTMVDANLCGRVKFLVNDKEQEGLLREFYSKKTNI